jgi:hypothetical protein
MYNFSMSPETNLKRNEQDTFPIPGRINGAGGRFLPLY